MKNQTEFLPSKWSRSWLAIVLLSIRIIKPFDPINGITVKPATIRFFIHDSRYLEFCISLRKTIVENQHRFLTGIVYFIEIHELAKEHMGFLNVLRCFFIFTNVFAVEMKEKKKCRKMFIRLAKRCYSFLLDGFLEIFVGAVKE